MPQITEQIKSTTGASLHIYMSKPSVPENDGFVEMPSVAFPTRNTNSFKNIQTKLTMITEIKILIYAPAIPFSSRHNDFIFYHLPLYFDWFAHFHDFYFLAFVL